MMNQSELNISNPPLGIQLIRIAYELLSPPLASMPAKYHAPLSLLLHSLSTGYISAEIARLMDLLGEDIDSLKAFFIGFVHDFHQKLVKTGLTTYKKTYEYIEKKLTSLNIDRDVIRCVKDSIDNNTCESGKPPRGCHEKMGLVCKIADMTHSRMNPLELLAWLRENVKALHPDLTVRFYSVLIPQPFARAYISNHIYNKIADITDFHITLASPFGLYVITLEEELPEVLELSWNELRVDQSVYVRYSLIREMEEKKRVDASIRRELGRRNIPSKDHELRLRVWSRFARMFYNLDQLDEEPLFLILPEQSKNYFVNIELVDVEYRKESTNFRCGLCGMEHYSDSTFPTTMYYKVSRADYKTEKWNRFLPSYDIVKTFPAQWRNKIGLCPFCMLDAVAMRRFASTLDIEMREAFMTISISKPLPIYLLDFIGLFLNQVQDRMSIENVLRTIPSHENVIVDYFTATAITTANTPNLDNICDNLRIIATLIKHGLYPVKYLNGIDTTIPDRLFISPHIFKMLDFSVTRSNLAPVWVSSLLDVLSSFDKSDIVKKLSYPPDLAPLLLFSINKKEYETVKNLLSEVIR